MADQAKFDIEQEQKYASKGHQITDLNNALQERTFRLHNLEKDVNKCSELIAVHDEDMLKTTRVLQRQIDEKQDTIQRYKEKL